MKVIDQMIENIPDNIDNKTQKYFLDVRKLLEGLKEHEVDIGNDYQNNSYTNSVKYLEYLEKMIGKGWYGYNTFNYGGRIDYDIQCFYHQDDNNFYILLSIHKMGDIRNYENYTGHCLLRFDSYTDYIEIVDNIERDACSFITVIDGCRYCITPHMMSTYLEVRCLDTGEQYDIDASNDEELRIELKKMKSSELQKVYENQGIR